MILAVNHRSFVDGRPVYGAVARPECNLVKAEAFTPVLGPLLRGAGQIAVVRERGDPAPVRRCVDLRRTPVGLTVAVPIHVSRYPDGRPLNRRPVADLTEVIRLALADLVSRVSGPLPARALEAGGWTT